MRLYLYLGMAFWFLGSGLHLSGVLRGHGYGKVCLVLVFDFLFCSFHSDDTKGRVISLLKAKSNSTVRFSDSLLPSSIHR